MKARHSWDCRPPDWKCRLGRRVQPGDDIVKPAGHWPLVHVECAPKEAG